MRKFYLELRKAVELQERALREWMNDPTSEVRRLHYNAAFDLKRELIQSRPK